MHLSLQNQKVKNVLVHLAIWLGYILYELITIFQVGGIEMNLWETFFNFGLYAILFYVNSYYVLPKFYGKRKYFRLVVNLITLFVVFTFLRYQLKVTVVPWFNAELAQPYVSRRLFLSETLWRGGYFIILSFGFWFASSLIKREKEKGEDMKKMRIMEKNIKEAELQNLRNQINPHFLFNTLNFLYDKANTVSEETGKAVLLLSDLMRYSLKETEAGHKAFLEDEVRHLKNYIEINQLRFDHKLQLEFTVVGIISYRLIVPLLLITFVENCFKYGELFDKEHPVKISLEVTDDHLIFKTHNKKRSKIDIHEQSTGIGHQNAINRLEAVYGERYNLNIKNQVDTHSVELLIEL